MDILELCYELNQISLSLSRLLTRSEDSLKEWESVVEMNKQFELEMIELKMRSARIKEMIHKKILDSGMEPRTSFTRRNQFDRRNSIK